MPVYEFYCTDCHVIFKFFSRRVNTEGRPACPRCARDELEKRVSPFAISRGLKEADESLPAGLDESRLESAMAQLAQEAEHIQEDDPRQMARLMRKLYETTGMEVGGTMAEAISRMEAGEDPETIEQSLGDALEGEDPFSMIAKKGGLRNLKGKLLPPEEDDTLHEME